MKVEYGIVDLFGNESKVITDGKKKFQTSFTDYDGFIDKFEVKKTTDDCYTPKGVYDVVYKWVNRHYNLSDKIVIRPFYPDGDFEAIDYPENTVVIDNPPFSIITKICRFYLKNNIKFFLFAPHLTNFTSDLDCTHIIASADIIYENGATVKTSFLSNIFDEEKIICSPDLRDEIHSVNAKERVKLPNYSYPDYVMTVSKAAYLVENGISFTLMKNQVRHIKQLDSQRTHKKGLFGSGFLIDATAAEAVKTAAEAVKIANTITWELSDRERSIIQELKPEAE